jgi:hypothetical protein
MLKALFAFRNAEINGGAVGAFCVFLGLRWLIVFLRRVIDTRRVCQYRLSFAPTGCPVEPGKNEKFILKRLR